MPLYPPPSEGGGLPTGWTQDEGTLAVTAGGAFIAPNGIDVSGGDLVGVSSMTTTGSLTIDGDLETGGGAVNTGGGDVDTGGGSLASVFAISMDGNLTIGDALDHDGTAVGFYGTTPAARPEAPASPTAQDVVDILLAVGLCTQAAP